MAAVRRGHRVAALPRPARHGDVIRHAVLTLGWRKPILIEEQGFLDSDSNFLTREAAELLAIETGQLVRKPTGTLYTEDLW